MVSMDKIAKPVVRAEPESFEPHASQWPFVLMAVLVLFCLMCLLFLDFRIASLLCMAGCAVVRYLGARAEEEGDDPP